jgi:hypothetical protein
MVLRHQVRILERQLNARVAYRPVDRAILAALSRLLARWRWRCFLVTPEDAPLLEPRALKEQMAVLAIHSWPWSAERTGAGARC